MEDNSQGFPCVEASLAELRGRIYRIVLPRQECLVNEHGRSPWEPLRSAGVSSFIINPRTEFFCLFRTYIN